MQNLIRILLVEDEIIIAMSEKQQLESLGYSVHNVTNGESAINSVENEKFDIILMDINLGEGLDGTQVAEEILKENDIPIVFLSSHTKSEIVKKTEKITSYGYVVKNSGVAVLEASIKMAIRLFNVNRELKLAELKLKNNEKNLQQITDTMQETVSVIGLDGNFLYANKNAALNMSGGKTTNIVGKNILELIPEEQAKSLIEVYNTVHQLGDTVKQEIEIQLEKGNTWFFNTLNSIEYGSPKLPAVLSVSMDITEQKRAEEAVIDSNEKYKLVFENSMDGIFFTSPDGSIISANPKACEILGSSEEYLIKKGREAVVDLTDKRLPEALSLRETNGYFKGELSFKKKTGEVVPVELATCIFRDKENRKRSYISFREISEQKKKEKQLKKTIQEKDYLMRELNHRVKNNLFMVSSLISLKNSSLGDKIDLSDIISQIDAIRIVHEKLLYQSEDITSINLREYIQELLSTVFSLSKKQIKVKKNIENVSIRTGSAIPIGLIINEIATNAMKHSFVDNSEYIFTVKLVEDKSKNQYLLSISNSGKPFPENIDFDNPETLGLRLISALISQLDGTIDIERSPHPVFTIRFPGEES